MKLAPTCLRMLMLVLVLVLVEATANAYPQWQFSSGAGRCSSCHYVPTGGGLLTGYGRDEVGEDLSTLGGNGSFLHGAASLPSWLAVGVDLRGAFVVNDVQDPSGASASAFPMQADLSVRLGLPAGFSLTGILGLRGQVRKAGEIVPEQNYQPVDESELVSREHFIMWRPATQGFYARFGRYYAPFGLRLPDHIYYVRRDLGFNVMEESYNLTVGWLDEKYELHVTAFAPDELRHIGGTEWGGAALYERYLGSGGLVGAQAKVAKGEGVTRWIGGGLAKEWVPFLKTLFVAEVNLVFNDFHAAGADTTLQLVALAGLSVLPLRGTVISIYGERSQTDLRVSNSAWNAGDLQISWFPVAHVELQALGRLQFPSGGDSAKTFFLQVHYFL